MTARIAPPARKLFDGTFLPQIYFSPFFPRTQTMARVDLENVSKIYPGGVRAVDDVSLAIADQEFVVLVGPSGCGKSTTLRMIAGLESITAGTLSIGDRVVNDVSPAERDIAMVFQSYALYPHMTVRANMGFALRLQKRPKAEIDARVAKVADTLGLTALLDRTPRQLSGGQRQRVAIGRAIVREPEVFLFDEPLSNLDAKLRSQMRREIAALHRRIGATSIYVTHDQVEAMTLGDRIVVMNEGRVQQVDTPSALYDRPANTFVAGFLGSPPMNLVRGTVLRDTDGVQRLHLDPSSPVIVGIRPEHIRVADLPTADAVVIELDLELAEPLGHEILVHAARGGVELTARIIPQPLPPLGSPLLFALDAARLHRFDAGSGARIW
jgi:multiple sugar transport system ATP-binding protein